MSRLNGMSTWSAPIGRLRREPLALAPLVERLRLTLVSAGYTVAAVPALVLAVLTVVMLPLGVIGIGVALSLLVVPATRFLATAHRKVSGSLLGEDIPASYGDAGDTLLARPFRWLKDGERWRDAGFCCFSATVGFIMSLLPVALLTGPLVYLVFLVVDFSLLWVALTVLGVVLLTVWWVATPALVRARALAERGILGRSRFSHLERRVGEVEESRSESLEHSAAEIRRIERDLHDGAQARIAAVGMNVGLAEKLMRTNPEDAAALLREARETSVDALEDLRGVVRGILPPVLADRGLTGAVEALVVGLPLPTTVVLSVPRLPSPVESAAYFAIAECLTNTIKHADADRAYIRGSHDGGRLRVTVGDDGRGGADPAGSGLSGVARRLAAFDGNLEVTSPSGEGTTITMELPCPID